ncbi:GNAT family N-acetyltransferase [Pedobacter fastidiosus]|uniref:GNAT family N-acetyltransferase n=1 Tax=Pedobacter fastidiosus TaxID=2765361 RepID=A0ABR7KV00_9SPHI|nr:GNAT family N-acetyltransferase [Pedobacter fastidiosus]MBC6111934.1 GNAT family N-acetyltransferase [Pedobacter fastidiosus]
MIRKAKPEDTKAVAPLIIQAMGELANKFSNTTDADKTLALFEYFFKQKNNQYSYEHTLVYEGDGIVLGSLNAYDGAKLIELRKNFLDYLAIHNNLNDFQPEDETGSGEFYLDTISVNPHAQGKGIGKQLIDAGIEWAKKLSHNKVGLLVEVDNEKALKLYQTKGFQIQNKKEFIGGLYHHMVCKIEIK